MKSRTNTISYNLVEVIPEEMIASYMADARERSMTVCSDYNMYRGEDILIIPAHDENFYFHLQHTLPLRVKRGYEIVDVTPLEVYLYSTRESYKYDKKRYRSIIENETFHKAKSV